MIYDIKNETMKREDMENLQLERFKKSYSMFIKMFHIIKTSMI